MVWDFKMEKRQFTWRWKSKCLVNKCLLGQAESMDSSETEDVNSLKPLRLQGVCPLVASVRGTLSRPQMKEELLISSRAVVEPAPTARLGLRRSWERLHLRQR